MEKDFIFTERVTESIDSINQFYGRTGYSSKATEEDKVFLCKTSLTEIVGAVRICLEENNLVLRGMYFLDNYRGKGLGRKLLENCLPYLDSFSLDCFAIPFKHLAKFYGLAEFTDLQENEAPHFLRNRLRSYVSSGHNVALMRRRTKKKTFLSILNMSNDQQVADLLSEDFREELIELQKIAELHQYENEISTHLLNPIIAKGVEDKLQAQKTVWMHLAPVMADRYFSSVGWKFLEWEPSRKQNPKDGDVDLRLASATGRVLDLQIKGSDSRGEVLNGRIVNGEVDRWIESAIRKAIAQKPKESLNPFVVLIVPNRNFPLSDMTDCVEAMMYGHTEWRDKQPPILRKRFRGLFFSSAKDIAAVCVLNTCRPLNGGFKYDLVTLINPDFSQLKDEFLGRTCYLENNAFHWIPKSPTRTTVGHGTILET